ncbi:MAG: PH domain-containing protein [Candidatus Omnitrophica bacterium]|nr:PH domain-containing protein [Candidatus Omnitrophota bacterium]
MVTPTFIKGIWISIQYGLSNKKGGFWGTILLLYTGSWILWTLSSTFVAISELLDDGDFAMNLIVLSVLILPPYLPIYCVWHWKKQNDEKQDSKIEVNRTDEKKRTLKLPPGIKESLFYGIENRKGGITGFIWQLYTILWLIWTIISILLMIGGISSGTILVIMILLLYMPIYYFWYDEINDNKQDIKILDTDDYQSEKMAASTVIYENTKLNGSDFRHEKTHEEAIISQNHVSTVFHENLNISTQTKNIIKPVDKILQNENVIDAISGVKKTDKKSDMLPSALVLTYTRIIFYHKKILGGYKTKDYPIKSINSITFNSGLIYDGIKLHTKTENLEIGNISKKDHTEDFVNNVKSCMSSSESRPVTKVNAQTLNISISRETEFYQGFIRLKMSITNTTVFVINDANLDFYFDEVILRMDRHEPDYPIKNGKIILGNINSGSSKSVAVYFDPMMCSKGTEIKCQINYSDAKGQIQTTWMEPKSISVVCPIMKTDSDINIGRLKEFVEKLPHRDSKIYQIHTGFDIDYLKAISREVIQKHDVKHIRTLYTKDGKTCEIWYYGETKVNNHDIVIRITISSENQSIELFAATQTAESLTGLLAEYGRELLSTIEDKITGKNTVNQVINVSIKDSIIQRSNLLNYCDIDGKCTGDVIVEDSIVQRSDIGLNAEVNDSFIQKTDVGDNSCPECGGAVPDGAKFCNECGGKLK